MKPRTCRRTASSRGSNHSLPAKGDGDAGAADIASVTAWVPPRSRQPEPTPPQPIPTNPATRPLTVSPTDKLTANALMLKVLDRIYKQSPLNP